MKTLDQLARDLANRVDWLFDDMERSKLSVPLQIAEKLLEVRDAGKAWRAESNRLEHEATEALQAACEHDWKRSESALPPYDFCPKCKLVRQLLKPDPLSFGINGESSR